VLVGLLEGIFSYRSRKSHPMNIRRCDERFFYSMHSMALGQRDEELQFLSVNQARPNRSSTTAREVCRDIGRATSQPSQHGAHGDAHKARQKIKNLEKKIL
jgi:hypothetical protein